MILYGAFKGMGDLICAAPAIKAELQSGNEVTLLTFPQVTPIIELLDFGANAGNLRSCKLPVRGSGITLREFFRDMSRLSPNRIYVSPHAPAVVASWKIPILLWMLKKCYWPRATLIGAESEPLSRLFGMRIPVSRHLPYMLREWTAYSGSRDHVLGTALQPVSFKESIAKARQLPYEYDLVIHPGAGTDNRKWPAGYFARLIGDLPAEYRVAVVGLPQDIAALRAVLPAGRAITFLSGSLEEAIVSIARSRVALTMDSGSMFFASLLHVPTVTLFGPSNPANVMIPGPNFTPIYEEKWSCQPCRRPKCSQRQVYCMAAINPATVLDAIIRLRRSAP